MKVRLQQTRNYAQFAFSEKNRDVLRAHLKPQHKKLLASMKKYGFLPAFPIMVKAINGRFEIQEGQHRFTFARELGLPVYFVTDDTDIDIADINQAHANWGVTDYAQRWAKQGIKDYSDAIALATEWGMPLGMAFALLGGVTQFSALSEKFRNGTFRITSRDFATRVARIYSEIRGVAHLPMQKPLLLAIVAACHVAYFDETRVLKTIEQNPELFGRSGTRDGYLEIIAEVYNFRRRSREPLAFDAQQAMRERNAVVVSRGRRKIEAKTKTKIVKRRGTHAQQRIAA